MELSAFDFHLPDDLIAQQPLPERAASRMLVLHRAERRWEDRHFRDLPEYLGTGDCLVLNDSRVFPARLYGHREGTRALPIGKNNPKRREYLSGRAEVLLLRASPSDPREWTALVRPGRKMRTGERIRFDEGLEAEIVGRGEYGERTLRFGGEGDLYAIFDRIGHVPLPPYIRRPDEGADRERYQTVFAREKGSVAAPTAGLHFTEGVIEQCRARGADVASVTLHVGLGTFQPLHAEQVENAKLHAEAWSITEENAATMRAARRLVCAGTTSVRTVESVLQRDGCIHAGAGDTDIFIFPGYRFLGTGAMLTNFHLPRTSLLLLVCAFAGTDFVLSAYHHAVAEKYRFYSYGDCMLIL